MDTTTTVTHPDGTRSTRTSATKVYTHAVEVYATPWDATAPSWGVLRWSQTEAAAVKAAQGFHRDAERNPQGCGEWASARVVPVDGR